MPRPDGAPGERTAWHARAVADVLGVVGGDASRGLSRHVAAERLAEQGPNRLVTRGVAPWWRVLIRQFADVLIAILAVAAVVSLALGEALDAAAILAILLVNGLLGFVQEWRAERALAALQQLVSRRCIVVRDGRPREVDAEGLVPGDLVELDGGARVPADLRLVETHELEVDESALTGESLSVAKDPRPVAPDTPLAERRSMAWMGTVVTQGHARGLVVATGMATEFGRIAELTREVERDPTPLQRRLAALGRQLGLLALAAATAVAVLGWALGRPALEMFLTGVSLAVAVVPEGLPAVVTVTLALGVRQMVRRDALPRRLQAVETLGSATTLLTDKTGTLTRGEMTVTRLWLPGGEVEVTGTGYAPEGELLDRGRPFAPAERPDVLELLRAAGTCNHADVERRDDAWVHAGDPTEAALVVVVRKADVPAPTEAPLAEFPFRSERKRMTVVHATDDGRVAWTKGAPEVVLERSSRVLVGAEEVPLDDAERARAEDAYRALAEGGMRTLALARRRVPEDALLDADAVERDLTLLGIVGILDPPRPEVPDAVERAGAAGIDVLMLTGDSPETARAVAERIRLPVERTLTGRELDAMEDAELLQVLERPALFARTAPEHKLRVARLLEDHGEVVGMTGDGVNDAPALREADIGIAMGVRGTDVAREAADLVLLDDDFATIVDAIEEGRREFDNIRKFVRYLVSSNVGETVAILCAIGLRAPLILVPVQILWINVVTDAVTAVALGLEPAEPDVMRRPPRGRTTPLIDRAGMAWTLGYGAYIGLAALALFLHALSPDDDAAVRHARTVAFTGVVVLEQVNLFNHRVLRGPLSSVGFFSNPWLLVAILGTTLLQLAALYLPALQRVLHTTALGWSDWWAIAAVSAPLFVVPEAVRRARAKDGRSYA